MISAATADDKIQRLLKIKGDPAVLKIIRTAYTHQGIAVDTRVRYIKTSTHAYMSVIGKR